MTEEAQGQLGKYRLLAELGRGGMARVYLALVRGPAGFNKLVVIKQIQAELAEDPDFVTMFLDEARLAARLNHPNVVQTNEVGQDAGRFFMAMEYLEGQTLRRLQNKLGEGVGQAMQLRVVSEALSGLHYAHELRDYDGTPLGVVHRDVSPHNLFVTYSGQVKVVDFGIAKALSSSIETRTGVLKGKVAYMSPEQALGEGVDRRADLYSVGVMLWQIAAGKRMFRGVSDVAVIQKLVSGDIPRLRDAAPGVDPRLAAVVERALAFRPDDRPATALALQAELEEVLDALPDRRGVRELGRLLGEHFADERVRIQGIVEERVRSGAEDDLPLLEATFSADSAPSGRHQSGTPSLGGPVSTTPTRSHASERRPSGTVASHTLEETTRVSGRGRGLPRTLALVVGAVVAVGGGAYLALRTQGGGSVPAASGTTAAAVDAVSHTLHVVSQPLGAVVKENDRVLGVTPLAVAIAGDQASREFVLSLEGYEPYAVRPGVLTDDLTVMARLVPAVVVPASASSPATASAEPAVSASTSSGPVVAVRPPYAPPPRAVPPPTAPPPPPPTHTSDIRLQR